MAENKEQNTEVIEPEILDENGNPVTVKPYIREEEIKEALNPVRKGIMGVLGAFVSLLSGFMMFCVFAVIFILVAIPMLILSLFGKKPNMKIFKYKI